MLRVLRKTGEFLAAFVVMTVVLALLALWRLTADPVRSTVLTPYIETALNGMLPGLETRIGESVLFWDNADRTLALRGDSIRVQDPAGRVVADLPVVKMKVSLAGLLLGRLVPAELVLEEPRVWLERTPAGALVFRGQAEAKAEDPARTLLPQIPEAAPEASGVAKENVPFLETLRASIDDMTRRGLLHDLSITKAVVSLQDAQRGGTWLLRLPELALHRKGRDLEGHGQLEVTQREGMATLQLHYLYSRAEAAHKLTARFSDINAAYQATRHPELAPLARLDMPLSGEVALVLDGALAVKEARLGLEGGAGFLRDPELWAAPRPVRQITLGVVVEPSARRLRVENAKVDFGGTVLEATAQAEPLAASPPPGEASDSALSVTLRLADLEMDSFDALWPLPALPDARKWIVEHMTKGRFTKGEVTLKGRFVWSDPFATLVPHSAQGTLSAKGGRVAYLEGMPPVEGVDAEATYDATRMDVQITSGALGAIRVQPFTLTLSDFEKDQQNIFIPLKLAGPVREVLELLDSPPLGYAREIGLDPRDSAGSVEGVLELRFPLLEELLMRDVSYHAQAQVKGFASANLIPGLPLSRGDFALDLDRMGLRLKGPVALNGIPLKADWETFFGVGQSGDPKALRHKATLTSLLSAESWNLLGPTLAGRMKGTTQATLRFAQPVRGVARLEGDLDFRQAALTVEEVNWRKPAGMALTASLQASLPPGKPVEVATLDVKGSGGVRVKGALRLEREGLDLLRADIQTLALGSRNSATLLYEREPGADSESSLKVEGDALDISHLGERPADKSAAARPKSYALQLRKLFTSDHGFLTDAQGFARRDRWGWERMELRGMAEGRQMVTIRLLPEGAVRKLRIASEDFGLALKGLGLTETVEGGKVVIEGEGPLAPPRPLEGKIKVGSFVVNDLPVLARLLSAVSPFGFLDLISGHTSFDRLDGHFRWQGEDVDFSKVRAAGSVFGLNIEGRVGLESGEGQLSGTLVPFSFFNSIIDKIPLLGDALTGGEGQGVIAAAYTVKGRLADPDISVNPVSLLTPGFLRTLFFRSEDHAPAITREETPPPPKKKAE